MRLTFGKLWRKADVSRAHSRPYAPAKSHTDAASSACSQAPKTDGSSAKAPSSNSGRVSACGPGHASGKFANGRPHMRVTLLLTTKRGDHRVTRFGGPCCATRGAAIVSVTPWSSIGMSVRPLTRLPVPCCSGGLVTCPTRSGYCVSASPLTVGLVV